MQFGEQGSVYNNFNTNNRIRSYSKSKRCDHREVSELILEGWEVITLNLLEVNHSTGHNLR